MGIFAILVLALGLAMDAFAVSIVSGSIYKELKVQHAFRMALSFGLFQALMPLIGALAGLTVREYVAAYDHWLAFGLLSAVGLKMICESFKIEPGDRKNPADVAVLLALSIATSIDALAVGITLSLIVTSMVLAVTVVGAMTFVLSYAGIQIGKRFGHLFESKIEALGGLMLIGLGVKIFLEHLTA